MSAFRPESKTPIHFRAPAATLALSSIVPILALIAFSPAIPRPAFLNFLPSSAVQASADPVWAGHLDAANPASAAAEANAAVRSTSYTSGFDPAAVGLGPLKNAPLAGRMAQRGCAADDVDKLADPVRAVVTPCGKSAKAFALPSPRPAALKTVVAADKPAQAQANGFAGFTSHLPSPDQLLTPFNYVGDKVAGLFKRS